MKQRTAGYVSGFIHTHPEVPLQACIDCIWPLNPGSARYRRGLPKERVFPRHPQREPYLCPTHAATQQQLQPSFSDQYLQLGSHHQPGSQIRFHQHLPRSQPLGAIRKAGKAETRAAGLRWLRDTGQMARHLDAKDMDEVGLTCGMSVP